MWGWTPFMMMLFIDVASASPLLPRGVTTRTWSTYRSTGFITWTLNGQLSTETYVDHTVYLTTETVDDQVQTVNSVPLPASTTAAAPQASVDNPSPPRPTTTPTPGPATLDNAAPATPVLSSSSQSTTTSTSTSISTSHSGSPTVQETILQRTGSASAVSSSSSQDSVAAASLDASEVVGLSKPQFWAVIGSTVAGVTLISLLLFAAYLKRKATLDLFCPVKEPADGSAMIMRIEPFVQSESLHTLNDQTLLSPTSVSTRSSTNPLPSLHSGTLASHSRTMLSVRPEKESPVPVVAVPDEIVPDDDMRPGTPPPVYTA